MSWLKDKLLGSTATFKFIAVGNQVLNQSGGKEYMRNYSCEFTELMNFIVTYKIEGVVFLSGDRHFSEVITYQPKGGYKMYDFTCSALTSRPRTLNEKEKANPNRVPQTLVTTNTFARFEISGPKGDRSLKMVTIDKSGVIQSSFLLNEKDLKMK